MHLPQKSKTQPTTCLKEVSIDDSDLYAIESIVVAATPTVFDSGNAEEFLRILEHGGVPKAYLQYDTDGHAVGYIALSVLTNSEYVEVRSIAVLPEYQHLGYGKKMMIESEAVTARAGRFMMLLVTSPENIKAIQFYERLGYVIIKRTENYYGDGTPRYVLEKSLRD